MNWSITMIKKLLQELSNLGQEMEEIQEKYEADNDAWWNGLSEEERQDAFYAVVKRIHKGELVDNGSYRHVLYNVFGFDGEMYSQGMECGFMELHNSIYEANPVLKQVNRVEVIDNTGRLITKYLEKDERVRYNLQDNNRTLKVFIDRVHTVKIKEDDGDN